MVKIEYEKIKNNYVLLKEILMTRDVSEFELITFSL